MVKDMLKEDLKSNIETLINSNLLEEASSIIEAYEKLIKNDIEITSMKSVIAIQQNNPEAALKILQEGLVLDSNNHDILYNLGYVYERTGKNELAQEFYKRAFINDMDKNFKSEEAINISRTDGRGIKDIYILSGAFSYWWTGTLTSIML